VTLAAVGQSAPFFWIALMLMLLFAVTLHLLPTTGYGTWRHLVLPALTLACYPTAAIARLVRSSMLDVLGTDYVRTARAKGLAERRVVLTHALKNAAMPAVTVIGLQFGLLLGGSIVCEMIFAWPGVGRLIIFAIYNRDYPLVEAAVFAMAMVFVLCNLLVDLGYAWLDPRVKVRA
jgi:peptide/nickel transport system permease protein